MINLKLTNDANLTGYITSNKNVVNFRLIFRELFLLNMKSVFD